MGVAQQGFGSWAAFGEQPDYDTALDSWADLWQKKYELVNVGLREESTPIVPQRIRATRSPIPNVRGRVMVSGSIGLQSHPQDLLPLWKEATMSKYPTRGAGSSVSSEITEETSTEATLTAATTITPSTVALVAPDPPGNHFWLGSFVDDAAAKSDRDSNHSSENVVAYWNTTANHVRSTNNADNAAPTWNTQSFSGFFGTNHVYIPRGIADSSAEAKTYLDDNYKSTHTYYIYDDGTADDLRKITYTASVTTVGVKGPVNISFASSGATLLHVDIQPEDAEDASFSSSILNSGASGAVVTKSGMYDAGLSPARLSIKLTNVEVASGKSKGYIGVFGLDQNDVPISELLEFEDSDITSGTITLTTSKYYKKVGGHPSYTGAPDLLEKSEFVHVTGNEIFERKGIQLVDVDNTSGTSTIEVKTVTDRKRSIFLLRNPLLEGNTFYIQKGKIPNSYFGVMFNSTTFQFGETCQVDIDVIGRNGLVRVPIDTPELYGMEQGRADLTGPADKGAGDVHNDAWNFAAVEDEAHPGWEGGIQVREHGSNTWSTIPCTDISFVINNNLSHPERYWFNRYHIKPTATDVREVMVNATVDYETQQGLDFQFKENLELEARVIAFFKGHANSQLKTQITLPKVQLNSTVDPEVSDNGPITQSFDLKCLPTDANAGNEAIITVEGTQVIGDLLAA